jgi:hypothetical protein
MPHACNSPVARWVNWGATVTVACTAIPSEVAVSVAVPGRSAISVSGDRREITDGSDEVKAIEERAIDSLPSSRAVADAMSLSSTSSVVSLRDSVGTVRGSEP